MYFRAESIQLIVSRSDSELEVQRYSMKKNILTVDPIMLEDELWMRQHEKPSPNHWSRFLRNRTVETEFYVFEFWGQFDSVRFLENRYPTFLSGSTHPYTEVDFSAQNLVASNGIWPLRQQGLNKKNYTWWHALSWSYGTRR